MKDFFKIVAGALLGLVIYDSVGGKKRINEVKETVKKSWKEVKNENPATSK